MPCFRDLGVIRDIVSTVNTTYLPGFNLLSTRGVEYLFLKALDYFKMFPDKPVTFNDIRSYIDSLSVNSRSKDWKVSAQNILFKLTTGPIGRLLNGKGRATIPDIIDKQVILELTGLGSETDRALFSQSFLLWLYYHRLAQPRSELSPHVLVIEEAHNLFLRRHDGNSSINIGRFSSGFSRLNQDFPRAVHRRRIWKGGKRGGVANQKYETEVR